MLKTKVYVVCASKKALFQIRHPVYCSIAPNWVSVHYVKLDTLYILTSFDSAYYCLLYSLLCSLQKSYRVNFTDLVKGK